MKLCIVEDRGYQNLFPLVKTRPVFGLLCGRSTQEERIIRMWSPRIEAFCYLMRPELEEVWRLKGAASDTGLPVRFGVPEEGRVLILNGRVLLDNRALEKIASAIPSGISHIWLTADTWGAVYLPGGCPPLSDDELLDGKFDYSRFQNQSYLETPCINYPWDLIRHNSAMLYSDFEDLSNRLNRLRIPPLPPEVNIRNSERLIIGRYSEISPFVTLDCSRGPVMIGDNVTVEPGAYIRGPVSIGDHSLVSAQTKIYENTTVGETSKVGGEISHSIIHGFSNKRHAGFLGNSYIGEWVNMGAGTVTSNMKNNYNTLSVEIDGREIDTGLQFVGLFMGDHTRTAINTSFNTASFVGVGCNIFGSGIPPGKVEDFTWGGIENDQLFEFGKFVESARRMMIRREVELSDAELDLLKFLHQCRSAVSRAPERILSNAKDVG